jgi:predicted lipid-binding transport protein (Tim44 family)
MKTIENKRIKTPRLQAEKNTRSKSDKKAYIRNAWPGKTKIKIEYRSIIPERNWKFWTGLLLTGLGAGLILFMLLKEGIAFPVTT